jgi:hypothetical protein
MTPSPPPPLSHPFPTNRRKRVDHSIPLGLRMVENPLVWDSSYQPPWRRSPPPQLSPPRASTQNSPSLITSTGKRHQSRSASPTRLTSSSAHKKIKYQSPFPLQGTHLLSDTSESHHLCTTPLKYKVSSMQHSTESRTRRVLRLEVPSLKMTSTISSKCSHWLAQLETPDEAPPVKMTPPPVSCPDLIKYGGPVPPHLSFVARGHQLPTTSRKTPFLTPPHFLPQFSPTSSRRGRLASESDAPQRRRTRGQRGQGGARVSVVQPVLPISGHISRAAESVPDLTSRLTHPPPPLGFEHNIGHNYVPCLIPLEGGRQVPATYVCVVMSINPQVIGQRNRDEAEYGGPVYAFKSVCGRQVHLWREPHIVLRGLTLLIGSRMR